MSDPWTAEPPEDPSDSIAAPALERRALQASLADLVRTGSSTAAFSPGPAGPGETGRGASGREALAALAAEVAQTAPAVEADEEGSRTGTSPLRRTPPSPPAGTETDAGAEPPVVPRPMRPLGHATAPAQPGSGPAQPARQAPFGHAAGAAGAGPSPAGRPSPLGSGIPGSMGRSRPPEPPGHRVLGATPGAPVTMHRHDDAGEPATIALHKPASKPAFGPRDAPQQPQGEPAPATPAAAPPRVSAPVEVWMPSDDDILPVRAARRRHALRLR